MTRSPSLPLPPAQRPARRLYEIVAGQIGQRIAQGEWPVGARLPSERDLALQLQVSRPSVREALIALEVRGQVEVRGHSGVYVSLPGTGDSDARDGWPEAAGRAPGVFDLLRARAVVESECAALAAERARPEHLDRLRDALQVMQAEPLCTPLAAAADRRFHFAIAEAGGNLALELLLEQLWRCGAALPAMAPTARESWAQVVQEHGQLLDAIASRDAAIARHAVRYHLRQAEVRYAASWRAVTPPPSSRPSRADDLAEPLTL